MKKTFPLTAEGKHPERLLEAIKHEIRKYFKRERRRALPEGADLWDFDCKFGPTSEEAVAAQESELFKLMDAIKTGGGTQFYVEILSKPAQRKPRPVSPA
jgi:Family of unknown function (DUF6172)